MTDVVEINNLIIIEKYDRFVKYIYPILTNKGGKDTAFKNKMIDLVIDQYRLINEAVKTDQKSKIYVADAGLATLKNMLRLMSYDKLKLISLKQYGHASVLISEVGNILGALIKKHKKVE